MGWRFSCSHPRILVNGTGEVNIALEAEHSFSFPSEAQLSSVDAQELQQSTATVELYEAGEIRRFAGVMGWKLEPGSNGYIYWDFETARLSCSFELHAGAFKTFKELCEVMLLSSRKLELGLNFSVIGFSSNGGTGAPTVAEFVTVCRCMSPLTD